MDFHRKLTSLFELISFFIWQKLRFNDTPMFFFIYLRHFGLCCGDALRGRRGFFTISLIIAHITKHFFGEFIDENGLHSCVKFHFDFCSINYLIAIYIKQGCLFWRSWSYTCKCTCPFALQFLWENKVDLTCYLGKFSLI